MATPSGQRNDWCTPITSEAPGDYTTSAGTSYGATAFADAWPEVFSTVVDRLARRGVDRVVAEDAVQEAGARAWSRRVDFHDAADLSRWVTAVALRLAVDDYRRYGRRVEPGGSSLDALAERPGGDDVHRAVEARLDWGATARAWRALSPADRDLLVGHTNVEPLDRKAAGLQAVRRFRARARLVALIEAAVAFTAVLGARLRRPATIAAAVPAMALTLTWLPPAPGRETPSPTARPEAGAAVPAEAPPAGTPQPSTGARRATDGAPEPERAASTSAASGVPSRPPVPEDATVEVVDHDRRVPFVCVATRDLERTCVDSPADIRLSHLDDALE